MKKTNSRNIFSEIPKKTNVSIRLPERIKKSCEELAKREGISFQNWLVKYLHLLSTTNLNLEKLFLKQ